MSARTHVNRGARVLRVLAALVCVALFVGISGFGSEAQARVSSSQSTSSSAGQDPSYSYKEPAGEIDLHIDELKRSHPSQGETGEGDEVDEDEAAGEDPGAEADGATAPSDDAATTDGATASSDDAAAAQKQSPYSVPYKSHTFPIPEQEDDEPGDYPPQPPDYRAFVQCAGALVTVVGAFLVGVVTYHRREEERI